MVDQSPRLGLDKFEAGDTDWSHSDLVDWVDENGIESDVIANRPASGEYDDEFFYAVDENTLHRWGESAGSWETTADVSPISTVFSRVGDVIAEAGDYAASQISNFSSCVIDAIDGSVITPSSVTTRWSMQRRYCALRKSVDYVTIRIQPLRRRGSPDRSDSPSRTIRRQRGVQRTMVTAASGCVR